MNTQNVITNRYPEGISLGDNKTKTGFEIKTADAIYPIRHRDMAQKFFNKLCLKPAAK